MDRFNQPLSLDYIDGNQVSPIYEKYDPNGEYMHFYKLGVPSWKIVSLDLEGVPINAHHGAQHYNPVTVAHYALELYSVMVRGGAPADTEDKFRRVIDWCVRTQNASGGWEFSFDHMFFKGRVQFLKAPWYSALSQGMMISALTRARNVMCLDWQAVIRKSLEVITTDVSKGGVKRIAFGECPFYEEYPTAPASYVLNGFMFCLLGLFDGWKATEDRCFEQAYQDGIDSLERLLPMYDLGDGSSYDLTHITSRVEGPNKARHSYHRLHIQLLSTLSEIENGRFSRVVSRWDAYLRGNKLNTN